MRLHRHKAVCVSLISLVILSSLWLFTTPAQAAFKALDLEGYFNGTHTTYLTGFFTTEHVEFHGIPFQVKLSGYNSLETPVNEKQNIKIWINEGNIQNIYFIGYGTYLAESFGHKRLYCDDINHFSFTINYYDGTIVEEFPTDVVLGRKEWADILREEGAVVSFPARPIAYIHLFKIPVDPTKQIEWISMNDKHEKGQYVVYAITLEKQEEIPPPKQQEILSANVSQVDSKIRFEMDLSTDIPIQPTKYTAFVWNLDLDSNPNTGDLFRELGIDVRIRVAFDPDPNHGIYYGWHGYIDRYVNPRGPLPYNISGRRISIDINLDELGNPSSFDWIATTITPEDVYPDTGHEKFTAHSGSQGKPYIITIWPPLLLLSVNGINLGQLTVQAWDKDGHLLDLSNRDIQFSSSNPTIVSVTNTGIVTVNRAEISYHETPYITVRIDGISSTNSTVVRVTTSDLPLPLDSYATFRGQYVTFFIPKEVVTMDFEQMMNQYKVANATDRAYLLQKELTGVTPFRGAHQIFIGDPGASRDLSICGLSGNPIRLGINLGDPNLGNCIMAGGGNPHWGVMWHEMGHNFTAESVRFRQLYFRGYNNSSLYSEGLASLASIYAEYRIVNEPGHFGLDSNAVNSIRGDSYGALEFNLRNWSNALATYEANGARFSEINADIMDGIFIRLADSYGWEIFPRFFKIFQPADSRWDLLELVDNETKMHTLTICALSVATGTDLRDLFKGWHFPVDDAFYSEIKPQIEAAIGVSPITIPSPPSPGEEIRSLQQLDTNSNCYIDTPEMYAALDAWNAGEISTELLFKVVDAWSNKTNICIESTSTELSLDWVRALTSMPSAVTFIAQGEGIASIDVEVYDLAGRRIFSGEAEGAWLVWNLRRDNGRPIANGVYLYVVTAGGLNGEVVRSEVQRLVILSEL